MASTCPNCGSPVAPDAATCPQCGFTLGVDTAGQPPPLEGARNVAYRSGRYGLGVATDGYAIWDLTRGGAPVRSFPATPEGWTEAWAAYHGLDVPVEPPSQWRRGMPIIPRPMRTGQVLDAAINLYRLHFRTLIPLVAFVVVPFNFLSTLVIRLQVPSDLVALTFADAERIGTRITVVGLIFTAVSFLFINPFMTAAVVRTAGDAYLGQATGVGAAYRSALPRIFSILWVTLLTTLLGLVILVPGVLLGAVTGEPSVIVLLTLIAVVPAIMVVVALVFASQIVVLEDVRGTRALSRSRSLTRGLRWKIFGTIFLAGILAAIMQAIFAIPFQLLGQESFVTSGWILIAAGTSVAETLATPFTTLVLVLLYFDARVRKEGFDLEVMAQQLGETAPDQAP